jgi:nucleotide-binding universal stress UspA family protein
MISKILVPTDGSKTARKAARYAVDLAMLSGATVIVLSVVDRTPFISPSVPGFVSPSRPGVTHPEHLIEPIEDYLKEAAKADMNEIVKLCNQNHVPSKTVIRLGHPVEAIVKEAERSRVDLIVIGSHGRSAIKAALLGSVTFGVIHKDTKIPVLVVRK